MLSEKDKWPKYTYKVRAFFKVLKQAKTIYFEA